MTILEKIEVEITAINLLSGNAISPSKNGETREWNIGNYHLYSDQTMLQLRQVSNKNGATNVILRASKRIEMLNLLEAMIIGISIGDKNEN